MRNISAITPTIVAAMLLTACGSDATVTTPSAPSRAAGPLVHSQTFKYTGKPQRFTVPINVSEVTIDAIGARGGSLAANLGGRTRAVVPVTYGENLYVYVGGEGSSASGGYAGGYNGGANGGGPSGSGLGGDGGGGASDVRANGDKLKDRIVVAGGGGGQGGDDGGRGGSGGGLIGGYGAFGSYYSSGGGGNGGRQRKGGDGGAGGVGAGFTGDPGGNGTFGNGGAGGSGGKGSGSCTGFGGGGGGGGYYGGGGGGGGGGDTFSGGPGGGGGGGSSFIMKKAIEHREWRGWKDATGNGLVIISW